MSGDRPLVIVADDDEDILSLVRLALAAGGYDVEVARDGAAALTLLQQRPASAAVLDIAMPGMDGLEVLKRVRGDARLGELPIVLLSARAQENDVAHGYELGASKYIRKPFSPRELVSTLDELVR